MLSIVMIQHDPGSAIVEKTWAMLHEQEPFDRTRFTALLDAIGVVTIHNEYPSQIYRCNSSTLRDSLSQLAPSKATTPAEQFVGDEWEHTILKNFFVGMRLKDIPASPKKRLVITRRLLSQFEPGVRYPEAQLNEILQRHHPDSAFFRKEFGGLGFMERAEDIYWRA